jgi:hypothetical protein
MTTFINANGLGQGDLHAGKQVGQRWFGGDAGYEASNSGGGQNSNARSIRVSFYERSTSSIGFARSGGRNCGMTYSWCITWPMPSSTTRHYRVRQAG